MFAHHEWLCYNSNAICNTFLVAAQYQNLIKKLKKAIQNGHFLHE